MRRNDTISSRNWSDAKHELQSTNEVLVTMNEEFNSSVEELQTTNEELETLNEELQSTNEELQTTNDELNQRSDDLNLTNALLDSVLGSLHRGFVLVDKDGCILSWNHEAEELWGLQAADILGKSFFVQEMGLPVEQLAVPIRKILDEGKPTGTGPGGDQPERQTPRFTYDPRPAHGTRSKRLRCFNVNGRDKEERMI